MDKEETKTPSGVGPKVAAIILGAVDALLAALLMVCIIINPAKGESLGAQNPGEFAENKDTYWQEMGEISYTGEAVVSFAADLPESPTPEEPLEGEGGIYEGFVFPDSDLVLLTDEMILLKVPDQATCQMAINEIYARRGYMFTKQENIDYFNTYEWYAAMEKVEDMGEVSGMFTEIEQANVEKLQAFMNDEGWNQEGR